MKNKAAILLLITVCLVCLTSRSESIAEQFDRCFRDYPRNAEHLQKIVEKLKLRHISHKVSEDGCIWYRSEDRDLLYQIVDEIESETSSKVSSISFGPNFAFAEAFFLKALENEKIPFSTKTIRIKGEERLLISWDKEYDKKVEEIKKKTFEAALKEKENEIEMREK